MIKLGSVTWWSNMRIRGQRKVMTPVKQPFTASEESRVLLYFSLLKFRQLLDDLERSSFIGQHIFEHIETDDRMSKAGTRFPPCCASLVNQNFQMLLRKTSKLRRSAVRCCGAYSDRKCGLPSSVGKHMRRQVSVNPAASNTDMSFDCSLNSVLR